MRLLFLLFFIPPQVAQQYLLLEPIEDSILHGRMEQLVLVCREHLSVNLDAPLALKGHLHREYFRREWDSRRQGLHTVDLEWVSLQVDGNLALQSINVVLWDQVTDKKIPYKLIFFLIADATPKREWKIYYLRGLKI